MTRHQGETAFSGFVASTLKGAVPTLLVVIIVGGFGFFVGTSRADAVQSAQVQVLQEEVKNLKADKVGREEFAEFRRSMDQVRDETRLLRQELAATREVLAGVRGK